MFMYKCSVLALSHSIPLLWYFLQFSSLKWHWNPDNIWNICLTLHNYIYRILNQLLSSRSFIKVYIKYLTFFYQLTFSRHIPRETDTHFCGIGYLPLKVKHIGYLQILIGYWQNSHGVTSLSSYTFYVTSTILIGYIIMPLLFDTPCLKNNWVFPKNDWVNSPPKSSLSVSLIYPLLGRLSTGCLDVGCLAI